MNPPKSTSMALEVGTPSQLHSKKCLIEKALSSRNPPRSVFQHPVLIKPQSNSQLLIVSGPLQSSSKPPVEPRPGPLLPEAKVDELLLDCADRLSAMMRVPWSLHFSTTALATTTATLTNELAAKEAREVNKQTKISLEHSTLVRAPFESYLSSLELPTRLGPIRPMTLTALSFPDCLRKPGHHVSIHLPSFPSWIRAFFIVLLNKVMYCSNDPK